MSDRFVTLSAGLLAIWLVFIVLGPKPDLLEPKLSQPLSSDTGKQGLLGLKHWLRQADIPAISLRKRYQNLFDNKRLGKSGNLLIISLPQRVPARENESRTLQRWLKNGNSVLLLVANGDRPEWSLVSKNQDINSILGLFDLSFEPPPKTDHQDQNNRDEKQEFSNPRGLRLSPIGAHPVATGISSIKVKYSKNLDKKGRLTRNRKDLVILNLAIDSENGEQAIWGLRLDTGHVWISRFADLFGNISLGQGDNARLIANMIGLSLGPEGAVIFDDMHMGLSDLYDPKAFYHDPRLHRTIWFILAFWLLYILGFNNRFGPVRKAVMRRCMSDFVRAAGGLFARRVGKNEIARRLIGHFHNEVRAIFSLPTTGKPVWELLQNRPKVDAKTLSQFRAIQNKVETGVKIDLVRLTCIICFLRKTIR